MVQIQNFSNFTVFRCNNKQEVQQHNIKRGKNHKKASTNEGALGVSTAKFAQNKLTRNNHSPSPTKQNKPGNTLTQKQAGRPRQKAESAKGR